MADLHDKLGVVAVAPLTGSYRRNKRTVTTTWREKRVVVSTIHFLGGMKKRG